MLIRPKAIWYYLTWRRPNLTGEHEVALARMTRREGIPYMVRLFIGIVTADEGRYTLSCAWIFLAYNYPAFICAAGYWLGVEDMAIAGIAWSLTLAFGTIRYVGWLIWLLNRWPPLAKN